MAAKCSCSEEIDIFAPSRKELGFFRNFDPCKEHIFRNEISSAKLAAEEHFTTRKSWLKSKDQLAWKRNSEYIKVSDGYMHVWEDRNPRQCLRKNINFSTTSNNGTSGGEFCVVVLNPNLSEKTLVGTILSKGFRCVRILSDPKMVVLDFFMPDLSLNFNATITLSCLKVQADDAINEILQSLEKLPWKTVAVISGKVHKAGSLASMELATMVSNRMNLHSNGETIFSVVRSAYQMAEEIKAFGLCSVPQMLVQRWSDAKSLLESVSDEHGRFKVVLKPAEHIGEHSTFFCRTVAEAKKSFDILTDMLINNNVKYSGILIQQYLEGTDYLVDSISLDGNHKIVAIWKCDRRVVNRSKFVLLGKELVFARSKEEKHICLYALSVLDIAKVSHGPAYMKIKLAERGPVLISMDISFHSGHGTWRNIATECIGYNQIDLVLDTYTNSSIWNQIPILPYKLRKNGREVYLISNAQGTLRGIPGLPEIQNLQSYVSSNIEIRPHDYVYRTVGFETIVGTVQLIHSEKDVVEKDYNRIRELERCGLLDFKVICPNPRPVPAVVIVDPFSSGAILGMLVLKSRYRLVVVFSEPNSPVADLVKQGMQLQPDVSIQHNDNCSDIEKAMEQTQQALLSLNYPIIAILAGAETGVELADSLSVKIGTRCNSEELTAARRNKFLMGEQIRKCCLRAARQALARSEGDVHSFFFDWTPKEVNVVVKPLESAGSDSVHLCHSIEEAKEAFRTINGRVNGLGKVNDGAIIQEYLDGTEYVVDSVSRDGVHKVIAIWEYDKRSVNGANFVYFGMELKAVDSIEMKSLVQYSRDVLNALEIMNGSSHMEIKMTSCGPCLVEVGSRCHGGEATWLSIADECVGYNQIQVTLDAYVDPDRFDLIPTEPKTLRAFGREVFLVSYFSGFIDAVAGIDAIRRLSSFKGVEMAAQPGSQLRPTTDCFTRPGSVQLVNCSREQLNADYDRIREIERSELFVMRRENEGTNQFHRSEFGEF